MNKAYVKSPFSGCVKRQSLSPCSFFHNSIIRFLVYDLCADGARQKSRHQVHSAEGEFSTWRIRQSRGGKVGLADSTFELFSSFADDDDGDDDDDADDDDDVKRVRKVWKSMVKERMEWIEEWEKEKGNGASAEPRDRRMPRVEEVRWECEVCGRICKSKAGLTTHRRRMHEVSAKKKGFECFGCKEQFKQEANLLNHEKVCRGMGPVEAGKKRCDLCEKVIGKKNFAAHRRRCESRLGIVAEEEEEELPPARVYKGKRKPYPECGQVMAATNISRHLREACGGGAGP